MKRLLVALAAAACTLVSAETLTATDGRDGVTIYDKPCASEKVLAMLGPLGPHAKEAVGNVGGQLYRGCWISSGSTVFIQYEDGDRGAVPVRQFKPRTEV